MRRVKYPHIPLRKKSVRNWPHKNVFGWTRPFLEGNITFNERLSWWQDGCVCALFVNLADQYGSPADHGEIQGPWWNTWTTLGKQKHKLGKTNASKTDEFSEKFQTGGGGGVVISNPNIYVAKFGLLNRAFLAWKWFKKVFSGYVFQ